MQLIRARITVNIEWETKDDVVSLKLVDGTPQLGFDQVVAELGAEPQYTVQELTASRAVFVDAAFGDEFVWRRHR